MRLKDGNIPLVFFMIKTGERERDSTNDDIVLHCRRRE